MVKQTPMIDAHESGLSLLTEDHSSLSKVASIRQERRRICELNPAEYNPRKRLKPGDEEYERLKRSIEAFGYVDPIIINADGTVIGGHQRLNVLTDLGYSEADVAVVDLNKSDEKALNIALNKITGEWDTEKLATIFAELDMEGYDLSLTGFGEDEYDSIVSALTEATQEPELKDPDADVAPPEVMTTKPGDVWRIGRHRLVCGDSTNSRTVFSLLDGKKADLVFTDPPYGMKKEADGVANDNLNYDDLLEFNKKWIPITFDALKENGSWYCWGIDEPLMDIYSHIIKPLKKLNGQEKVTFRNLITWDKGVGQGQMAAERRSYARADEKCLFVMRGRQTYGETNADYWDGFDPIRLRLIGIKERIGISTAQVCEYAGATTCTHWFSTSQWEFPNEQRFAILLENLLSDGKISRQEYDEIRQEWYETRAYFDNTHDNMNNVWHFATLASGSQERNDSGGHATPKPIALCGRAIKSSSREGEIVLDVFGGSGSTLIACEQFGRIARLVELEPKWCDTIVKRYMQVTSKKDVVLVRDGKEIPVEETGIMND